MQALTDISETLLIPLYGRAQESQSENPILHDPKAVEITETLNASFRQSSSPLHQRLASGKIRRRANSKLVVFMGLRSRKIDRYCTEFLKQHPDGIIVELGCGFSTRYHRLENGVTHWYHLDLPEVIAWRRQLIRDSDRNHTIACSVLDHRWMDEIAKDKPVLFVAEGLLMYLPGPEVKSLILEMQRRFAGSELVAELASTYIVKTLQKRRWRRKFQHDLSLGGEATFSFGVTSGREFEGWDSGLRFLEEWTIFDDHEKKLGWMNLFAGFKKIRQAQTIVHYQLGTTK